MKFVLQMLIVIVGSAIAGLFFQRNDNASLQFVMFMPFLAGIVICIATAIPTIMFTTSRMQLILIGGAGLLALYGVYWFLSYQAFGATSVIAFMTERADIGLILSTGDEESTPFAFTGTTAYVAWIAQIALTGWIIAQAMRVFTQYPLLQIGKASSTDADSLDTLNV